MAFLDKTSLIVDAVLTDKGREKLSTNSFTITKFALGDDDIDYSLYNEANTNGPNYYGIAIENMPLLEAFTRGTEALRYKLTTRPPESNRTPEISSGLPSTISLVGPGDYSLIEPGTVNLPAGQTSEEYIFELVGSEVDIDFVTGNYADQQRATEHQVIIEQIDAETGMALPRRDMISMQIDGVQIEPLSQVARITQVYPEGHAFPLLISGNFDDVIHVAGVESEGEVYLGTDVGITQSIRNPGHIYNRDGIKIMVNGAGCIQVVVRQRREERQERREERQERREERQEERRAQHFHAVVKKSRTGNELEEVDISRGAIADGVDQGILRANMRVFIEYEARNGRLQRINATIASINARRDRLELARALSETVPDLVNLIVEE